MLKKSLRLKSPALFKRTLQGRRLFVHAYFFIYTLPRTASVSGVSAEATSGSLPQFGLIVSRKTARHAVQRNRLKRRYREIIRTRLLTELADRLTIYQTIVIIIRSASAHASYRQLETAMVNGFSKRV